MQVGQAAPLPAPGSQEYLGQGAGKAVEIVTLFPQNFPVIRRDRRVDVAVDDVDEELLGILVEVVEVALDRLDELERRGEIHVSAQVGQLDDDEGRGCFLP